MEFCASFEGEECSNLDDFSMCLRKLSVLFFMTQSCISFACSSTFQVAEPWLQSESSTPVRGRAFTNRTELQDHVKKIQDGINLKIGTVGAMRSLHLQKKNPRDARDGHDQKQSSTFL